MYHPIEHFMYQYNRDIECYKILHWNTFIKIKSFHPEKINGYGLFHATTTSAYEQSELSIVLLVQYCTRHCRSTRIRLYNTNYNNVQYKCTHSYDGCDSPYKFYSRTTYDAGTKSKWPWPMTLCRLFQYCDALCQTFGYQWWEDCLHVRV